ncbi:WhiB family transcriptional regulator [Micromonospora sp. C41]|uniref:WhiB family transcriptional regulator n=1 Tax=Micromonospora sp. C41 TaxID=2824878 RepID=UPI0027DDCFD9|nr:WhiB family transcriptional regulator [Micromonospora sp. C41]
MTARLPNLGTVPTWHEDALCRQYPADLFFPERGENATYAKAICRRCPVRDRCLQWALDKREQHGVWGGTTEKDRRDMQRREAVAA